MSLDGVQHQMSRQRELALETRGEAPQGQRSGEALTATQETECSGSDHLMEAVVERSNARMALRRVRQHRGRPGSDGMSVEELPQYLVEHWEVLRAPLLAGTDQPKPVRRQSMPKPGGGVRELGIPGVLDRVIQQAIRHVLQPRFDPTVSPHSHGVRPGRSAHGAIREAQQDVQAGRRWVVDVDIEACFDRVNHEGLLGRLAKRLADKRLLRLIRRDLEAGSMAHGVVMERYEGTPQGGPLAPLLAHGLLDEVDKELERRGQPFVRYADDCNVDVRSRRAGERVLQALRRHDATLRLHLNEDKSTVARVWSRRLLGYSGWIAPGRVVKRRVARQALKAMKDRVRQITSRSGGRSLEAVAGELREYLTGWKE